MIPLWASWALGVAAIVGALSVLWTKVILPFAHGVAIAEKMYPILKRFTDDENVLGILNQIAAQFRTDSGSSLRDVVNRLETAAVENKSVADQLILGVEVRKQLDETRDKRVEDLVLILGGLIGSVEKNSATGDRIERAQTQEREKGQT